MVLYSYGREVIPVSRKGKPDQSSRIKPSVYAILSHMSILNKKLAACQNPLFGYHNTRLIRRVIACQIIKDALLLARAVSRRKVLSQLLLRVLITSYRLCPNNRDAVISTSSPKYYFFMIEGHRTMTIYVNQFDHTRF